MLDVLNQPATQRQMVTAVCQRIPPLWDLRNFVAVNPFLGFVDRPIDEVASLLHDGLGATLLPGSDYYRRCWKSGKIKACDLASAAARYGYDPTVLQSILADHGRMPTRTTTPVETLAEAYDRVHGTDWNDQVIRSAARWCSVHVTQTGQSWHNTSGGLFQSWREAATIDRSLDIMGLRGFRKWVGQRPMLASDAIAEMLEQINLPECDVEEYCYRLLGGLYGWASYFRRESWEKGCQEPGTLAELLAIRLCLDSAVTQLAPTSTPTATLDMASTPTVAVEEESVRLIFQEALEDGYLRRVVGQFRPAPVEAAVVRPQVQAIFCIDVRSEVLRRHLEAESSAIETRGFAGFFGVSLHWSDDAGESARCPVLLQPSIRLGCSHTHAAPLTGPTLRKVAGAPAAAFSFVEVLGITYGIRLIGDMLTLTPAPHHNEASEPFNLEVDGQGQGLQADARVDLAAGILKNIGFAQTFARVVLLCGHEGHSSNNPHAAGLDCGACGGHGGAINARVAAAVLNDASVRAALALRGWELPADTHFLAGVHDTATDEVDLLDLHQLPSTHQQDVAQLRQWLRQAAGGVRAERVGALGLADSSQQRLAQRAADWSEVRPEWALARNAAFIAARRCRTRGVDLAGRAFLHEYDADLDGDSSILNLILSAPMVVASWINLQYYASTVDNRTFGSGDKALHNRVGTVGVVLGNGGDLRTGLARQSVHSADGTWYHEPLRLQVIVEADNDKIERVLAGQPGVKALVENGWVRLFALNPQTQELQHRRPGQGWEKFNVNASDLDVSE